MAYDPGMITRYPANSRSAPSRSADTITTFGIAALVRCPDGQVQLCGGGRREQIEAREWISLFLPEAVLKPSDTEKVSASGIDEPGVPKRV